MTRTGARLAIVTNFIAPYRAPVFRALSERVSALRIILSTAMESNRDWRPDWEGLDVVVERALSVPRVWRHPSGFRERVPLHVPLRTGRHLSAFDPDVVISGELGTRSAHSALWCRRHQRPLILWATLSERTEQGRGPVREALRRFLLARAEGVIVNGRSGARYIAGFGYPEDRIHLVPQASPVRPPPRGSGGGPSGPLELLYVGQMVERKGVGPLLETLGEWCRSRHTPVRLTLVGPGVAPSAVGPAAGGLLEVRSIGPVPFEALSGHYEAADLLVFPTLADEWGLVVNEAMGCGLPVLGSVHGQAVTELVEDGRTGWLYDPERPGELERALDRVHGVGRERIRAMGARAKQRVAGLTPDAMAERIAAVAANVLEGRGRGASRG